MDIYIALKQNQQSFSEDGIHKKSLAWTSYDLMKLHTTVFYE